jgi:alkaline phosphatase
MTAIITGVKTDDGIISVDQDVVHGDHTTVKGNELPTLLELAEQAGLSTGIVSTASLTHATPAACYAHSPSRSWECDADMPAAAKQAGFPDIARQFIEFPYGNGPEVALSGGRGKFLPYTVTDPEDDGQASERTGVILSMSGWGSIHAPSMLGTKASSTPPILEPPTGYWVSSSGRSWNTNTIARRIRGESRR